MLDLQRCFIMSYRNWALMNFLCIYLKHTVFQLVLYGSICTCKCGIAASLHQGMGATGHLCKLFSFSKKRKQGNFTEMMKIDITNRKEKELKKISQTLVYHNY